MYWLFFKTHHLHYAMSDKSTCWWLTKIIDRERYGCECMGFVQGDEDLTIHFRRFIRVCMGV